MREERGVVHSWILADIETLNLQYQKAKKAQYQELATGSHTQGDQEHASKRFNLQYV